MSLDTQDKKYIHTEVTKEIKKALLINNKIFKKEFKAELMTEIDEKFERWTGVMLDEFRSQTKLIAELVNTRPSREEMNERFDAVEQDIRYLKLHAHSH